MNTKKIILIDISIDFVTNIKFHGKEILIMAKVIVSITDMLASFIDYLYFECFSHDTRYLYAS